MSVLESKALTKRYDGRAVVDEVDLVVDRGEVVGIVGSNGAGKSTLLRLLLGTVRPTTGTATVLGMDPWCDSAQLRQRVGHLPERIDLDESRTGWEHLSSATDRAIVDADAESLLDRIGLGTEAAARRTGTYSPGTARRLALGMALIGDPDLLLVDEPAAGLDDSGLARLEATVREVSDDGTAVVVTSRRYRDVQRVADRIGTLVSGELVGVEAVDDGTCDGARVELIVDRVPAVDLESIPGVEDVITGNDEITALVSAPDAKSTVILEVAHAGVAIYDLDVTETTLDELDGRGIDDNTR